MHSDNILTRKLELFGVLSDDDKRLLNQIIGRPREVGARKSLIAEGDAPDDVFLILDGFAYRSKTLLDGKRQIFAYLLPGDFCDLHVFILKAMDHDISTVSACTVVQIPRKQILQMLERPRIAKALWWATMVDEGTLREWIVNIGQREAIVRVAHLFCELYLRLQSVQLAQDDKFEFPLTQGDLADTLGISAVHVNRVIQGLRRRGLIELRRHMIVIIDLKQLKQLAQFDPNYLHLQGGKVLAQA